MKKIKLLIPVLPLLVVGGVALSLTSCSDDFINFNYDKRDFVDLTFGGCGGDALEFPESYKLKDEAHKYFPSGTNISEISWFLDKECTQPAGVITKIDDNIGEHIYYGKFQINLPEVVEIDGKIYRVNKRDFTIVKDYKVTTYPNTASNWETDNWCTLIHVAQGGLDALKSAYGKSTFVGLEKEIEFNGVTHRARVVAENHDTIGSLKALTFQTVTCLCNSSHEMVYGNWQYGGGLSKFTNVLPNYLQKQFENYNCFRDELTLTELGYTQGDIPSSSVFPSDSTTICEYWNTHKTDDDRITKNLNGGNVCVWTGSLSKTSDDDAWAICKSRSMFIGNTLPVTTGKNFQPGFGAIGYRPCFCI